MKDQIQQQVLFFNKSLATNITALLVMLLGYNLVGSWHEPVLFTGLFALSGALTNWLAIHMLFEKVPGLYGSGVIAVHFKEFKAGIQHLIVSQFFNKENISRLIKSVGRPNDEIINFEPILSKIDFKPAFEGLVDVIMLSPFGSMLGMLGGKESLAALETPFTTQIKTSLTEISNSPDFQRHLAAIVSDNSDNDQLLDRINTILSSRLDELTPSMVKNIIHEMIHQHLGWLVVWGGVFGGLIGLGCALIK